MALALPPISNQHAFGDYPEGRLYTPRADSIRLVSRHDVSRVPCPQGRATMEMKTRDLPNGTSSVFEGAALEAEPAAAKTRAAHTPPIDIIGGRQLDLYSNRTQSVFKGAALAAEPAAAKPRAAHTPPIDIIGGRRLNLYSNGTPSALEGAEIHRHNGALAPGRLQPSEKPPNGANSPRFVNIVFLFFSDLAAVRRGNFAPFAP